MAGLARSSRTGLRAGLGVLAALGVLLVAGRLSAVGSDPSSAPDEAASAPAQAPHSVVELTEPISGLAVDRKGLWVAHGGTVDRLDPRALQVTGSAQAPRAAAAVPPDATGQIRGLAAGGGAIWATLASPARGLVRIDAATARVVAVLPVAGVGPAAVGGTGAAAGVWVVCCGGETFLGPSRLVRVDPASNRVVAQIPLPGLPDAVGVGPSGVWVRAAAGPVWRIDPVTNRVVAEVPVPRGLGGTQGSVLVGRDAVWVSDPASATVLRIDPRSNRVVGRVEVAGAPLAATADGTVVAVSGGRVLSLGGGPLRGVHVDELNGAYASALAATADTIWIAESDALLRVDRRELR
jgi:glutamine cyclotransferase